MKVLFATDDSKFSEAAVKALIAQFRPEQTQVLVMHVVEPIAVSTPPQMATGYFPELADQLPHAKMLVQKKAEELAAAGFATESFIAEGNAKAAILDKAEAWSADLIVLGSHGRRGFGRFLLGSVSEAVARHAHCSVEIVRINP